MKIAVAGCPGRMGRLLVKEIIASGHEVAAGTASPTGSNLGRDIGTLVGLEPLGLLTTDQPDALFTGDVIIDFTTPETTRAHAELAFTRKVPLVVGTTGLDEQTRDALKRASDVVPVIVASNYSRGVALLTHLAALAAAAFPHDDLEIVEMHHRNKVDAPSGTALSLGEAVATARSVKLADVAAHSRSGKRATDSIGFASLRGGSVIGDHTLVLALDGERVELTHKADDRAIFVKGAVAAALWLTAQKPGLYSMKDFMAL